MRAFRFLPFCFFSACILFSCAGKNSQYPRIVVGMDSMSQTEYYCLYHGNDTLDSTVYRTYYDKQRAHVHTSLVTVGPLNNPFFYQSNEEYDSAGNKNLERKTFVFSPGSDSLVSRSWEKGKMKNIRIRKQGGNDDFDFECYFDSLGQPEYENCRYDRNTGYMRFLKSQLKPYDETYYMGDSATGIITITRKRNEDGTWYLLYDNTKTLMQSQDYDSLGRLTYAHVTVIENGRRVERGYTYHLSTSGVPQYVDVFTEFRGDDDKLNTTSVRKQPDPDAKDTLWLQTDSIALKLRYPHATEYEHSQ